jgi:hypothetical protein
VTKSTQERLAPTPERERQGEIRGEAETVTYGADGRPVRSLAFRVIDTLAIMRRRGSITLGMAMAGAKFRLDFYTGNLEQLHAAAMEQRVVDCARKRSAELPAKIEDARQAVADAIDAVGGLASACGACVWHVVGCEETLKEWASQQGWAGRHISEKTAAGILIGALGTLQKHYKIEEPRGKMK